MYRWLFNSAMNNAFKRRIKKRHGVGEQKRSNDGNTNNMSWPSQKHKCILIFHDESKLPSSYLRDLLKPYGTVAKQRNVISKNNVMSAIEMSTSVEAEVAWRDLAKKKLTGMVKVIPDQQHMTIQSYSPYWDESRIQTGLSNGELLSGSLRINPRMFQHAFISDGNNADILIDSVIARNRALPGDVVAVKIRPEIEWVSNESLGPLESSQPQMEIVDAAPTRPTKLISDKEKKTRTGDVVGICERYHNRLCVGCLVEKRGDEVLFRPIDNCLPRLMIPASHCPQEFFTRPGDFSHKLFLAEINSWEEESAFPHGSLKKFIGDRGEIESETARILLENGIDDSGFPPSVEGCLPTFWEIPSDEYKQRRDLRSECIFTVDPQSAKDLDDALHCRKERDDLYEVGVHIADVSYFVNSGSELDKIAATRCTTVYLVQKAVPMLPSILSEQLCSLNPGEDRLTYSVIWKITGGGDIVDEWCGRTVISSCVKLSYDQAQSLIESSDGNCEDMSNFPSVMGGHTLEAIRSKISHLHHIAQSLRKKRMENGALRLDQLKLAFTLDDDTGLPNSCYTYKYRASNELVEEFMLLANISVARRLKNALPEHAFLRCHPKPKSDMLDKVALHCSRHGVNLNVSSAKSLAESLREACTRNDVPEYCSLVLNLLLIKPQLLAKYFCSGSVGDEEEFRHYALNIPVYTHFTSPIRRYADILVHRQLSIALGDPRSNWNVSTEDLEKQAKTCNDRKSVAKKAQDLSLQLFFYALVKTAGSIEDEAVVLHVYDHSFDVLPVNYGAEVHRVYLDNLPLVGWKYLKESSTLRLVWPDNGTDRYKLADSDIKLAKDGKLKLPRYSSTFSQSIKSFSAVKVVLEASEKDYKIKAFIRRGTE